MSYSRTLRIITSPKKFYCSNINIILKNRNEYPSYKNFKNTLENCKSLKDKKEKAENQLESITNEDIKYMKKMQIDYFNTEIEKVENNLKKAMSYYYYY